MDAEETRFEKQSFVTKKNQGKNGNIVSDFDVSSVNNKMINSLSIESSINNQPQYKKRIKTTNNRYLEKLEANNFALRNNGNTCCFNSILQAFICSEMLSDLLIKSWKSPKTYAIELRSFLETFRKIELVSTVQRNVAVLGDYLDQTGEFHR